MMNQAIDFCDLLAPEEIESDLTLGPITDTQRSQHQGRGACSFQFASGVILSLSIFLSRSNKEAAASYERKYRATFGATEGVEEIAGPWDQAFWNPGYVALFALKSATYGNIKLIGGDATMKEPLLQLARSCFARLPKAGNS
jgi:hypothetical protein